MNVLLILRRHTEHGIEFQTKQVANMSNKSTDLLLWLWLLQLLLLPLRSCASERPIDVFIYKWDYAADVDGDDLSGTRNGFYHANLSIMLTNVAHSHFIYFFPVFFCTLIIYGSLDGIAGEKKVKSINGNVWKKKLKDHNYRFVHFYEVYLFTIQFNCYLIIVITGTIQTQSRCVHTLTRRSSAGVRI